MKRTPRYDEEFKRQAVELYMNSSISLKQVARELGVSAGSLRKWRKEVRARKKRIQQIINGEIVGKATKEVIEACQAAVIAAAIIPAVVTSVSTST